MDKTKFLIEGRNLEPKPMTIAQINKFCQLHKYLDSDKLELAWAKKQKEHVAYWSEIYKDKNVISYPKLKLAWKRQDDKASIAYKQITWQNACKVTLQSDYLVSKIQSICHANYCKFDPDKSYDDPKGFVIFMSLPELGL